MKKLFLMGVLLLSTIYLNAQSCPTNVKRNNGNNCTSGGTGGGIEIEFATQPDQNLQILLITSNRGTATVITSSKNSTQRAGKWFLDWCFEKENLGPISQGSLSYTFYIDANGNQQRDLTEPTFVCGQTTLPISIKEFTAKKVNNGISLMWVTEQENNNDGFEIQRKLDNGKFEVIAYVKSKSVLGSGAYYSFNDTYGYKNSIVYYRLRQIDLDGKSVYSDIRTIKISNKFVSVYPNPSLGNISVSLSDNKGVNITLEDFSGRQIQKWSSIHTKNFTISNLRSGVYVLRVNTNIGQFSEVIIVK